MNTRKIFAGYATSLMPTELAHPIKGDKAIDILSTFKHIHNTTQSSEPED